LSYATNAGNLRLAIADLSENTEPAMPAPRDRVSGNSEAEIER